jgi:hypothetical protein
VVDKEGPAARGKRILEEEAAAEAEAAKAFDPLKLIANVEEIQTTKDPILGEIKYTVLTTQDMFEIAGYSTPVEQTKQTLFRLLHKAYPDLKTPDDILKLPAQTVVRLGEILEGPDNFFQIPRRSRTGSKTTETPKQSAS